MTPEELAAVASLRRSIEQRVEPDQFLDIRAAADASDDMRWVPATTRRIERLFSQLWAAATIHKVLPEPKEPGTLAPCSVQQQRSINHIGLTRNA